MVRPWHRWIPAASAPVVVGAVVLGSVFASSASADPAERTPQQVIELAASSTLDTFSGTIEQSSSLGLPDLSGIDGATGTTGSGPTGGNTTGSDTGGTTGAVSPSTASPANSDDLSSALELLTGAHTARVYVDGRSKSRVQILDDMAERDAIRNGDDLWLYDSSDDTAVHSTLPAPASGENATMPGTTDPSAEPLTPTELATKFLDAVDPSTDVTIGDPVRVAGRSAYNLILTPDSDATLVGSIRIAVDADTGLPLSVDIFTDGSKDAAFHLAFSSLSLDAPSAELFDFTPPAGTDITEKTIPAHGGRSATGDTAPDARAHPEPVVTGSGWDTVVELAAQGDASTFTENPMFAQATTAVDGGRVLQTALVTVLVTDDGRVFAGAVPADRLQAAATAYAPAAAAE